MTVLIQRLFKFLSLIFVVELLDGMIYLCNKSKFKNFRFKFLENIYICEFWALLFCAVV